MRYHYFLEEFCCMHYYLLQSSARFRAYRVSLIVTHGSALHVGMAPKKMAVLSFLPRLAIQRPMMNQGPKGEDC